MDNQVKLQIDGYPERILTRTAVAHIDSGLCVNCGKCRRICPVEAIEEVQRAICRFCPDCGDSSVMLKEQQEECAVTHACSIGCPLGTTPEGFVNLAAEGRWQAAYDSLAELNPLPHLCAMVCAHPCTDECKRGLLMDKPINIRGIKRAALENATHTRAVFKKNIDKRIAIIGAGPAGITAAFDLLKKGYRVKVFEQNPQPGGMVRMGVPDFRLDKTTYRADIAELEKAGMEIEYNVKIGSKPTIDDLLADGFAAVIIAAGASKGVMLPIKGQLSDKVFNAVTFMQRVNSNEPVNNWKNPARASILGETVVIGSGSVALDTARTALRKGATKATCVCLESFDEMLAPKDEIEDALEEGVVFINRVSPLEILADFITVKGVRLASIERVDRDDSGRFIPVLKEGAEQIVAADSVVFAIGQTPEISVLASRSGIELNHRGAPVLGEGNAVKGKQAVFAAGDVMLGRGSIITAMESGRKAAAQVDELLAGRTLKDRAGEHKLALADNTEKIFPIRLEKLTPIPQPKTHIDDRAGFDVVELGYTKEEAVLEARRCMKCGFAKVDDALCIGCRACEAGCPENAISFISIGGAK